MERLSAVLRWDWGIYKRVLWSYRSNPYHGGWAGVLRAAVCQNMAISDRWRLYAVEHFLFVGVRNRVANVLSRFNTP